MPGYAGTHTGNRHTIKLYRAVSAAPPGARRAGSPGDRLECAAAGEQVDRPLVSVNSDGAWLWHTFRAGTPRRPATLPGEHDPSPQEVQLRAPEHLPLHELNPVDVSFYWPGVPGE
jgi:hypothetical protein